MIQALENGLFVLQTPHSAYAFQALDTGHLEHLHYGAPISPTSADALSEKKVFAGGNLINLDPEHPALCLEDLRLEMSGYGKGDIREPMIEVIHPDGSRTTDFRFREAVLLPEAPDWDLPTAYSDGKTGPAEHLKLILRDEARKLTLELYYSVYEDCDVICRKSRLYNEGDEAVTVERLMSTQLDFEGSDLVFTSFHGAWAREMQRFDVPVTAGCYVNSSATGTSSSRANPFVMLHPAGTSEDHGSCYGLNLIYSGNHYEALEVSAFGKSRFVSGVNPRFFTWRLEPGEHLDTPEAVMTWSGAGFTGMSRQMHAFVREHIVRGTWKHKTRPVLLNSWEACYFDISESKLLRLAKAGKQAGIELFVMDDGWFGERNDDTSSLGDWTPNRKKLPGGLSQLSDKIHNLGLLFGIWVEPEMVNVNSQFYAQHPDYVMQIPGQPHSEGRNQRLLDLSNPAVVDHMIEVMTQVFSSARIEYVKWDMNRIFSDVYSPFLPPERQGETAHRYVLGLYRMMKALTERFPDILFEGCAAGGNRFDLGILCYFPQIWASDNTDALCRLGIQEGYSYGYPMSTVSAHVSACPNHQTLRTTPLDTRFAVAAFGVLGYEYNFSDLKNSELERIAAQITWYKTWREVLQWGEFYRGSDPGTQGRGNLASAGRLTAPLHTWTCVAGDQSAAVGLVMQELTQPNAPTAIFRAKGLSQTALYRLTNDPQTRNIRQFGDLINTAAPVHIRQDSHLHYAVSRLITMPGEQESVTLTGQELMGPGLHLKQAFAGTGYSDQVRFFQDFGARLYYMTQVSESEAVPEAQAD